MQDINIDAISIPEVLPLLPVKDVVLFPSVILPLFVGRESSIQAVEAALSKDRLLFLSSQKDPSAEVVTADGVYQMGCVGMIMRMHKLPVPDGRIKILVQGVRRAMIKKVVKETPNFYAKIEPIPLPNVEEQRVKLEAMIRTVKELLEKIVSHGKILSPEILIVLDDVKDPGRLADLISSYLGLKVEEAQPILEMTDPGQRLQAVMDLLHKELDILSVQEKIQTEARGEMTKIQREYYLREQLRAIKSELGDSDPKTEEIAELSERIEKARMPKEVHEESLKQLRRLEGMHPDAAEASIVRTYLDWLVELPWKKSSKDNIDLVKAKEILDEDHFDLEKVKERILEFLGVTKLKKTMRGPILCFAGPPGVGKTSLGRSIAKAMGREFGRVALGGMRDEAEIRGHRRTYVGAMPGRIIQSIKQAGTNNPVFILDEVDKLGSDFRGDPSSALLEVLDPEQNYSFRDHYLNLPFDLSNVMFIATANMIDTIPAALRDRMEIIHLSGYTLQEKLEICKRYILPKQIKENGIQEKHISLDDEALSMVIDQYTREAGLRNLEREVASLCRKVARKVAEGFDGNSKITADNLHTYLGSPKYIPEAEQENSQVGVATGLAWTQAGGEILFVESSLMKGKGMLTLTGHLGDVMKESARAALTFARSNAKELNISDKLFQTKDIHIHVPAGAVPKDGPSAGVTMATAIISALVQKPINRKVAMTGEISLRGRVMPVGGIREKVLAAKRAKITTILIPQHNVKDLDEIPPAYLEGVTIIPVGHITEVIKYAFSKNPKSKDALVYDENRTKGKKTAPKNTSIRKKTPRRKPQATA
ncbi:MAG TPA: endopeptidase La [Oligoflexia bacterium]|nr:endopeptidase La [Oligoflexia bacterium]HMR25682.1 endopeptidase La [Oligoflexia bacterium]